MTRETGEYIKKTDVLDKAVIETLSDYTEHDVVHVDWINKLPTYSFPEREKGEWILHNESDGWFFECNKCNSKTTWTYDFCPHCGADMRGKAE